MFRCELCTPIDLVFGPLPESEPLVKLGMDYFHQLRERLMYVHELAQSALVDAGIKQHRTYYARGRNFGAGGLVWVYSPIRKKGLSPKLMPQWAGLCIVLEQLSDVVYWVRLTGVEAGQWCFTAPA